MNETHWNEPLMHPRLTPYSRDWLIVFFLINSSWLLFLYSNFISSCLSLQRQSKTITVVFRLRLNEELMHDGFVLDFVWFILLGFLPSLLSEPRPQHWHLPYSIGTFLIRNLTLPVPWTFFFLLYWPLPPFRVHIYAPITFPEECDSFVNLKNLWI